MFYRITATNTTALYVWASNENDVVRYVAWLNLDRRDNVYSARRADENMSARDDVMSCDEPDWDNFMQK